MRSLRAGLIWAVFIGLTACGGGGAAEGDGDGGIAAGGQAGGSTPGADAQVGGMSADGELRPTVPNVPLGEAVWGFALEGFNVVTRAVPFPDGTIVVGLNHERRQDSRNSQIMDLEFEAMRLSHLGTRVVAVGTDGRIVWALDLQILQIADLWATEEGVTVDVSTGGDRVDLVDEWGSTFRLEGGDYSESRHLLHLNRKGRILRVEGVGTPNSSEAAYRRGLSLEVPGDEVALPQVLGGDERWRTPAGNGGRDGVSIRLRDGGALSVVCDTEPFTLPTPSGELREFEPMENEYACVLARTSGENTVEWLRELGTTLPRRSLRTADLFEMQDGTFHLVTGLDELGGIMVEVAEGRFEEVFDGELGMRWTAEGEYMWTGGISLADDCDVFNMSYQLFSTPMRISGSRLAVLVRHECTARYWSPSGVSTLIEKQAGSETMMVLGPDGEVIRASALSLTNSASTYGVRILRNAPEDTLLVSWRGTGDLVVGGARRVLDEASVTEVLLRVSLGDLGPEAPSRPVRNEVGLECGLEAGLCGSDLRCLDAACASCSLDVHCASPTDICSQGVCAPSRRLWGPPGYAMFGQPCYTAEEPGGCWDPLVCHPERFLCAECITDVDCRGGTCESGLCDP